MPSLFQTKTENQFPKNTFSLKLRIIDYPNHTAETWANWIKYYDEIIRWWRRISVHNINSGEA